MIVAYARVSTDGQTLDAQLVALRGAGAERVFSEKISGTVTERKALARAIAELGPGDCLLVSQHRVWSRRSLVISSPFGCLKLQHLTCGAPGNGSVECCGEGVLVMH